MLTGVKVVIKDIKNKNCLLIFYNFLDSRATHKKDKHLFKSACPNIVNDIISFYK
jgi:uncharacterized protein (DUF2141 family)